MALAAPSVLTTQQSKSDFFLFSLLQNLEISEKLIIFAAKININMEVVINNSIYKQAADYAKQQGLNLTEVIEGFLVRFIGHSKATTEQPVPDIVMSLFGAGESIADDDLNAREAYYQYLEEKYK